MSTKAALSHTPQGLRGRGGPSAPLGRRSAPLQGGFGGCSPDLSFILSWGCGGTPPKESRMRIDVHAHYFPDEYVNYIARILGADTAGPGKRAPGAHIDLDERFVLMDSAGIDMQVLSASALHPYAEDRGDAVTARGWRTISTPTSAAATPPASPPSAPCHCPTWTPRSPRWGAAWTRWASWASRPAARSRAGRWTTRRSSRSGPSSTGGLRAVPAPDGHGLRRGAGRLQR